MGLACVGLAWGLIMAEVLALGVILLWATFMMRWPAIVHRDDMGFSGQIYRYGYAIAALGTGTVIGGLVHLLGSILFQKRGKRNVLTPDSRVERPSVPTW